MMKVSNEIISNLKEHQSSTPSKWRENAEWRIANKSWLRYSQYIAMMMLDKMEELKMNQKQLSELMGCSQQYVSKVLKGQENLSLETLSKIERCLKIQILSLNHSAYLSVALYVPVSLASPAWLRFLKSRAMPWLSVVLSLLLMSNTSSLLLRL